MSKRGRPKGSTCFVRVKLADLNTYLKEDAVVSVSKKFLEEIGLTIDESVATIAAQPEEQPNVPEFTVTEFD